MAILRIIVVGLVLVTTCLVKAEATRTKKAHDPNPFREELAYITQLEKKLAEAEGKTEKADLQKQLDLAKTKLEMSLAQRRKPLEQKLATLEKGMARVKGAQKELFTARIQSIKKQLDKLDVYAGVKKADAKEEKQN